VIAIQTMPPNAPDYDGWLYDVKIEELFRVSHREIIQVYTGNDSGRFPLENGKEYVLFAAKSEGRLEIDNCEANVLLADAGSSIQKLRTIRIPADALVEGNVKSFGAADQEMPFAGVQIVFRSGGTRRTVVSDKDGNFQLHVPPGLYSADIRQVPGWRIEDFNSIESPSSFHARAGRCSALQFVARKN